MNRCIVAVMAVMAVTACKSKEAEERDKQCLAIRVSAARDLRLAISQLARPAADKARAARLQQRHSKDPDEDFAEMVIAQTNTIVADGFDHQIARAQKYKALADASGASLERDAAAFDSPDAALAPAIQDVRDVIAKFADLAAQGIKEDTATTAAAKALLVQVDARLQAGIKNDETRDLVKSSRESLDLAAQTFELETRAPSGIEFGSVQVDLDYLPKACPAS